MLKIALRVFGGSPDKIVPVASSALNTCLKFFLAI